VFDPGCFGYVLVMTNTNDPVEINTKDADGHTPSDTALGRLNKPGGQPTAEPDEDGSHENSGDTVLAHLNKPDKAENDG
jgi:hypothetical protein